MNDILKKSSKLMGNHFEISVVTENPELGNEWIEKAFQFIKDIEYQLTTYSETSDTFLINRAAGLHPVQVHPETFALIERCQKISVLTQGAFDITYGSVDKSLWNFDTSLNQLPDPETALKMVRLINFRNIHLNKEQQTIFLQEKGMRIGFGGIGKGYAAEKTRQMLKNQGVSAGIVNASGDLTTWGNQPDGKPWTIGIADPNHASSIFSYLEVSDMAVATSGNYEKFIWVNGRKYSHTINPKTGLPITGIK
ncbi:MAG: FAD:protein FMN transferase, partial [Bacteroidetes bacterium]|nr:FAD:protein FMN transferase [Bacteroidota bacterium]